MDKFHERMKDYLDDYDLFLESFHKPSNKALFLNKQKKPLDKILKLKKHPFVENGYLYEDKIFPAGKSPYYLAGLYYIQEPSSMMTVEKFPIEKGDIVLDMCSAPGGKSCAILNKLDTTGLLISNDIDPLRSKILSENIERFGAQNAIVTNVDPLKFENQFSSYFDKILLDAPCSGEGMFRSKEKAMDTYSFEKVMECVSIQKKLIKVAYNLLKPGGLLMYSTCTYNQNENEEIIQYALEHFQFQLMNLSHEEGMSEGINMKEAIRLYPHRFLGEGQFMALLQKQGHKEKPKVKTQTSNIPTSSLKIVKEFFNSYLNCPLPPLLRENQGHIYAIKKYFPELKNIKILRNGLYLGEVRKNYFIPSMSLCLALNKDDFKKTYNFNVASKEIRDYIQGLTLEGHNYKGYGAILVDNYPLSFFKESNMIKNLFPKGLRRNLE